MMSFRESQGSEGSLSGLYSLLVKSTTEESVIQREVNYLNRKLGDDERRCVRPNTCRRIGSASVWECVPLQDQDSDLYGVQLPKRSEQP